MQDLLRCVCRLQEVNKTWKESPFIRDNRDALSAEVCDLLDLIFVVDPRKRITVPEIMKHPWYGISHRAYLMSSVPSAECASPSLEAILLYMSDSAPHTVVEVYQLAGPVSALTRASWPCPCDLTWPQMQRVCMDVVLPTAADANKILSQNHQKAMALAWKQF